MYSRVFAHSADSSDHHGNDDDHRQQGTDHDASYLVGAQALCGTHKNTHSHTHTHFFTLIRQILDRILLGLCNVSMESTDTWKTGSKEQFEIISLWNFLSNIFVFAIHI